MFSYFTRICIWLYILWQFDLIVIWKFTNVNFSTVTKLEDRNIVIVLKKTTIFRVKCPFLLTAGQSTKEYEYLYQFINCGLCSGAYWFLRVLMLRRGEDVEQEFLKNRAWKYRLEPALLTFFIHINRLLRKKSSRFIFFIQDYVSAFARGFPGLQTDDISKYPNI